MRHRELFEAQDRRAACRDLVHGGATHAADADYDHIVHPSLRSVLSREIGGCWKVRRSRAAL